MPAKVSKFEPIAKRFWPTFLVVLPLSAVIASFFTIFLAVQNAPVIEDDRIGRFAKEAPVQKP